MEKQQNIVNIEKQLSTFKPSGQFYKSPTCLCIYSAGVKFLAEQCKSFWLLSDTSIKCPDLIKKGNDYVNINLQKTGESGAVVFYEDGNKNLLFKQEYDFTTFPLEQIKLCYVNNILYLPSETRR